MSIVCRSATEIEKLARVNALVARVLKELAEMVRPGVTTKQLDELAEKRLREAVSSYRRDTPRACRA